MKLPLFGPTRPGSVALALFLGSLPAASSPGQAPSPPPPAPMPAQVPAAKREGPFHKPKVVPKGTLGYGPPGLHPGFQGFGLGYHRGYGYGGAALGVGAEGGYPLYGGPGYPHQAPALRRVGGIAPFCFFGGNGGPNVYQETGPLAPDDPVVTIPPDSPLAGDYGPFTGAIPYPEATFAPYATQAAGDTAESPRPNPTPAPAGPQPRPPTPSPTTAEAVPGAPDARSLLGVDTDAVVDAGFARGLKVTRLQPGGAGEKAGLQLGDVIRAANGFLTEQPGHLSWVVASLPPGGSLRLEVLAVKDGEVHTLTARRP